MGTNEKAPSNVYTQKQFAAMLNVSERTLARWAANKWLVPYHTVSGRLYYTDEHLEAYWHPERVSGKKGGITCRKR